MNIEDSQRQVLIFVRDDLYFADRVAIVITE